MKVDAGFRKVTRDLETSAGGAASAVIDVAGEVRRIRATCTTTGAVVSIYTLENEGDILATGDTVFDKIITDTATATPAIIRTSGSTTSNTADVWGYPQVDQAKIVVASGGDTKSAILNIYIR